MAEVFLGISQKDILNKNLFDVIEIKDEENSFNSIKALTEFPIVSKELIFLKDNTKKYVYCTLSIIKNQNNKIEGYIFIFRDITEQKEKQLILDELNIKFNTLFNSMKEGVSFNKVIYNRSGKPVNYKIIDCNYSFIELLNLNREQIIGKTATFLFKERNAPYLKKYLSVLTTQKPLTFDAYFKNLNKYFIISAVFINKDEFASVYLDITKIKLYEKALVEKQKELEEYLYATSHDLRAPLVNIHGFTEILKEKYLRVKNYLSEYKVKNEEIEKIFSDDIPMAFKFISESTQKMDLLISGILKISKAEKKPLIVEEINMNTLIQQVLDNFKFIIEKISAKISVKNLPSCYGDRELLQSLFSNLIENAIKYKDKERPLEIIIEADEKKEKVIYKVIDNGVGIEEKNIDKIWGIYYRIETDIETDLDQRGQGIGLSIVKKIVQRNNGRIWVNSKKGVGSTFFVELSKVKFKPTELL